MEYLNTQQAAERLGIDTSGVRKLILSGRLPATKIGRDHLINESDLALVAERKPGRPPKPKDGETAEHEGETTAAEKPTKKKKAKAVDQKKAAKKAAKKGKAE